MTFDPTQYFKKLSVLDKGYIELCDAMLMDPRLKIVNAARVSYNKQSETYSEKDSKLVKFLYQHGHFSTYRHSSFTFRIKAPLFVFRQWWKYQIGSSWIHDDLDGIETNSVSIKIPDTSWNEVSGRYVELSDDFYIPDVFRKQSKVNKQGSEGEIDVLNDGTNVRQYFIDSCQHSYNMYKTLTDSGVAKEIARAMLPQNVYSECIWTPSLETILHFFEQRLKPEAQYEIREYAVKMEEILSPLLGDIYK